MRCTNLLVLTALSGAFASAGCEVGPPFQEDLSGFKSASKPEIGYGTEVGQSQDVVMTFHNDLSLHGRWVQFDGLGRCWFPNTVSRNWRPYTVGQWVYTDYGWSWDSDEPWGYATYHYGRWFEDSRYGWVWMPGTTWASAWVAWRSGGGYIGWAPLGPSNRAGLGDRFTEVETRDIPAAHFSFVEEREITDRRLSNRVISIQHNATIISETSNITSITTMNGTVVNPGPSVYRVERATGRSVERAEVRNVNSAAEARAPRERGEVVAYRPESPGDAQLAKDRQSPRAEPVRTDVAK